MGKFKGAYVTEWAKISYRVKKAAGWRCIRCGHPNEGSGPHNRLGCLEHCDLERHPEAIDFPDTARDIIQSRVEGYGPSYYPTWPQQRQRVLTVHHFDGNKSNNVWWNLMALCQVCHLVIQGKVVPQQPWMFAHSEWFKSYCAGFYAATILGIDVPREFLAKHPRWIDRLLDYPHLSANPKKVSLELKGML